MAKVKFTNTHDRLALKFTFENGDSFTYASSRSRDSFKLELTADSQKWFQESDAKMLFRAIQDMKFETFLQKFEAIQAKFKDYESFSKLMEDVRSKYIIHRSVAK